MGKHLVDQLVASGKYYVTVFDIRKIGNDKVVEIVGDLRKPADVEAACKGMDVVFHVATAAPTGENALNVQLMESVNVTGTQIVIDACVKAGVKKLVYTSSASVVFQGEHLDFVDESTPYATKPMDFYTRTKIDGEKLVLSANGKGGLATVALRPSGIFGEGDMVFVPTTVRQAKKGKMKYIIGNGKNLMDWTYVGNVAQAHLQAADHLALDSPLAGQKYFITNQDPVPFWRMLGDVCEGLGYERPRIHLPFWLIFFVAFVFEYVIRPLLKPIKELSSDFTVNRILITATNRTFSCARAKRDFAYIPQVSVAEGVKRTLLSFQHLRADKK